ncbi:MAG TPA: alpha/beta hydrolase [Gammaproteobacteria bacterium]|jgi:pimeloyl-ACP methyl ester carboxylesterase
MAKRILLTIAAALIVAAIFASAAYRADMKREYERVRASGTVLFSPYGDIEYTEGGSGPAVLVIHGSGGGYDQGELVADAVLGEDFRSIRPSRFGYLRSTFREDATWEDQAHAYAYLLDHLGIDRVAVVAMSHGGPSALLFAVLHPERVSSLTLVSCGVASSLSPDQAQADRKGEILTSIFKFDFPYWAVSKLAKRRFMQFMGATDAVIASLTSAQRLWVERIIDFMNPASLRSAGVAFDNEGTLPGRRIAGITAPTLIFHAVDDTLQLYHNAEFAVSTIPDAKLVSFEHGGHVVVIVEQSTIRAAAQEHIVIHMRDLSTADGG